MKQYNGEKAIISLTSWKARINTVGLTLFSLYKKCPGFHIVLVLSEEEFPKKEAELPDSVMAFVEQDLIEILWVYKNTKSFKKVLPTMEKYKDVPIISADDDCVYICNYAEELYKVWSIYKDKVITSNGLKTKKFYITRGPNTLYPPKIYEDLIKIISRLSITLANDDALYAAYNTIKHINIIDLHKKFYKFHSQIKPLSDTTTYTINDCTTLYKELLKCL